MGLYMLGGESEWKGLCEDSGGGDLVICCGEGTKGGESLTSCLKEAVVTYTLEAHEFGM